MDARTSPAGGQVDVLVRTFNSAATLERCLASAERTLPLRRVVVVDRNSTDATQNIARQHGAHLVTEEVGIGRATRLCLELAETEWVLFLDSDVEIVRKDFWPEAVRSMKLPGAGAVVGCAVGHPFLYGLPLGLTLLPREWALSVEIPPSAQGSETYFLRRRLAKDRLRIHYVPDAMIHEGTYRGRHWPEWQGSQVRAAAGVDLRELVYSGIVVLLIHLNTRRLRDVAYAPIFYLKFLRGYFNPGPWRYRDRRTSPD